MAWWPSEPFLGLLNRPFLRCMVKPFDLSEKRWSFAGICPKNVQVPQTSFAKLGIFWSLDGKHKMEGIRPEESRSRAILFRWMFGCLGRCGKKMGKGTAPASGCQPKNRGVYPPKWMVKIREKPIFWWMIWGAHPYFWKHPSLVLLMGFAKPAMLPGTRS